MKNIQFLPIFFFIFLTAGLSAQYHDNHWIFGYYGGGQYPESDSFGLSILSFLEGELKIEKNPDSDIFFNGAGTAYSNTSGDLQCYSNAMEIRNKNDIRMINDILGSEEEWPTAISPQTILFLPGWDNEDTVYLFRAKTIHLPTTTVVSEIQLSTINLKLSNGRGVVLKKNIPILIDSLTVSPLTATRHANGRDWWMLFPEEGSNRVYTVLFSPQGAAVVDTQTVDFAFKNGVGGSKFTPDGTKFIRFYVHDTFYGPHHIDILDFDRCTGQLSRHRQDTVGSRAWAGGLAVSPDSRYLYVSHYTRLYQYDLWADDILATKDTVGVYDGYTEWGFFTGTFYQAHLALDGKIYMNATNGVKVLHVVQDPDQPGDLCRFEQHAVRLPTNNVATLANHPNYRLGPIDGSPCDTLGLDNLPLAWFRSERDETEDFRFLFRDLSFYEPQTWAWTFGDGTWSDQRHPAHEFPGPGVYEVCLAVSNANGADTLCRTLELGVVRAGSQEEPPHRLWPNPVHDLLILDLGGYIPARGRLSLTDAAGRPSGEYPLRHSQERIEVGHLPAGVYFYTLWDGARRIGAGRVLKW